jgi:hypothetical protein
MMRKGWGTSVVLAIGTFACIGSASAQLRPRTGRFTLDAELLSAGRLHIDPEGTGGETNTTVIGVGANQLGSSRAYLPTTPLGLGAGYVVDEKWIIGLRLGFGYDWISPEEGPNERVIAVSAVPKVTWVPSGDEHAKFFVDLGPLIQYNRIKAGGDEQNLLTGGFEVGVGTLRFFGRYSSLDLGAYFQGRFGKWETGDSGLPDEDDVTIRDMRGVIRLGGSLWPHHYREDQSYDANSSLETRTPAPAETMIPAAPEPAYVPPPAPATMEPPASSMPPASPAMPPQSATPPPQTTTTPPR